MLSSYRHNNDKTDDVSTDCTPPKYVFLSTLVLLVRQPIKTHEGQLALKILRNN